MGNSTDSKNYKALVFKWAFFALIFLLAFGIADNSWNAYVSIAMVVLIAMYLLLEVGKFETRLLKSYLVFLIPAIALIIFTSLSNFWGHYYVSTSSFILNGVIQILGGLGMLLLGMQLKKDGIISFKLISYAIFGGLALVTFVSLIASMAAYGPFYPVLQQGKKYIYDSYDYVISAEAIWFTNFRLREVDIYYVSVYGVMLASALLALLWVKPKEDKISFFVYLGCGLVGLSQLVLITNKRMLICFAIVVALALVLRFVKFPKKTPLWEKIVGIGGVSVIGIIVLFMFIVAILGNNIYSGFLARIFNNGLTAPINQTIYMTFHSDISFSFLGALFGADFRYGSNWAGSTSDFTLINLRTVEFTALLEGGLLAFLGICFMIVFGVMAIRKFLHEGEEFNLAPVIIALLFASYLVTMSLCGGKTFPYNRYPSEYHSPFSDSSLFYIVILLYGYCACRIGKEKERKAAL